jgi:hypothetical protein
MFGVGLRNPEARFIDTHTVIAHFFAGKTSSVTRIYAYPVTIKGANGIEILTTVAT